MTGGNGAPLLTQEELDALFGRFDADKRKDDHTATDGSDAGGKAATESVTNETTSEMGTGGTGATPEEHSSRRTLGEGPTQVFPSTSLRSEATRKRDGLTARQIPGKKGQTPGALCATFKALAGIPVTISVRVGKAWASLESISAIGPGTVLRLDTLVNEPVKLLIDDVVIAEGEVVEVGGYFGVRIKTTRTIID
ncbi:MAG TPA: hypothetical protein GX507_09945 [Clostridia bacterium]|nr:hypothetical protein [Clostridia bacterium]